MTALDAVEHALAAVGALTVTRPALRRLRWPVVLHLRARLAARRLRP